MLKVKIYSTLLSSRRCFLNNLLENYGTWCGGYSRRIKSFYQISNQVMNGHGTAAGLCTNSVRSRSDLSTV